MATEYQEHFEATRPQWYKDWLAAVREATETRHAKHERHKSTAHGIETAHVFQSPVQPSKAKPKRRPVVGLDL